MNDELATAQPPGSARRLLMGSALVFVLTLAWFSGLVVAFPLPLDNADEAFYSASSLNLLSEGAPRNPALYPRFVALAGYPQAESHGSLYSYALALAYRVGGPVVSAGRGLSVVSSALTACLVFVLASVLSRSEGERAWTRGALAVALFVCFPGTFEQATSIRAEAWHTLLTVAAVAGFYMPRPVLRVLFAGALLAVGFRTRVTSLILLPWMLTLLFLEGRSAPIWRRCAAPLGLVGLALVLVVLISPTGGLPLPTSHGRVVVQEPLQEDGVQFHLLETEPPPPIPLSAFIRRLPVTLGDLFLPGWRPETTIHLATFIFLGLGLWFGHQDRSLRLLVGLALVAMLLAMLFLYRVRPKHFHILAPLTAIILARGLLSRSWGNPQRKRVALGGLLLVGASAGGMFMSTHSRYRVRTAEPVLQAWEAELREHAQPGRVLIAKGGFRLCFFDWPQEVCEAPYRVTDLEFLASRMPVGRVVLLRETNPLAADLLRSDGGGGLWNRVDTGRFGPLTLDVWERKS